MSRALSLVWLWGELSSSWGCICITSCPEPRRLLPASAFQTLNPQDARQGGVEGGEEGRWQGFYLPHNNVHRDWGFSVPRLPPSSPQTNARESQ